MGGAGTRLLGGIRDRNHRALAAEECPTSARAERSVTSSRARRARGSGGRFKAAAGTCEGCAMASRIDVGHLLYELCTELGFCLPPEAQARLIEDPPDSVDAFTDAVIVAEGMDPAAVQKRIRRDVRSGGCSSLRGCSMRPRSWCSRRPTTPAFEDTDPA